MNGMEMLLKSFGLKPDEIKKQISEYGQLVIDLHSRMVRIEEKQDRILRHLFPTAFDPITGKEEPENVERGNERGDDQPL